MTNREHQAARRQAARLRGDCGTCCKRPSLPGRFRCAVCDQAHRDGNAADNRRRAQERRAEGLCVDCGRASLKFVRCVGCRMRGLARRTVAA